MFTVYTLAELAELLSTEKTLYVRYSSGPEADAQRQSTDHESGLPLPGIPANSLNPPRWWTLPAEDWLARRVCQYLRELREGARPWALTGREVDFGPDNEPLLDDVHPVAWLAPALLHEARERYQGNLDAGRATH
ncbi:DUF6098 family protein [Amycolatopsis cynarae]|uniref:DUF6098 family protein n=1 Tax=Amycolatopsis cynarae TaxID=2995223 RepID=A0ABY7ATY8_9PSEU|nr:DUF6098 family protein [Amycolatopsis sp. HUAS 11-8]WAL63155.1 DUF6098 family protein [Amycolatopsis sp. HUAS 11-8]